MSNRKSEINFEIALDEENVPEKINWKTTDGPVKEMQETRAILLSVWDKDQRNALRLDLWTKEMQVDEMNILMFETLMTLADTYERATREKNLAIEMRRFARFFGEKAEVLSKPDDKK